MILVCPSILTFLNILLRRKGFPFRICTTISQHALEEPEKRFDRSLFRPLQMPSDTVPFPEKPLDA
jgi:hypothetical protein